MSDVFANAKTVLFASDGTGAAANASGCIKDWWDSECPNHTEAEHVAARDKMMDAEGFPLVDDAEVPYTYSNQRIALAEAAATGVEVGMCAYICNSTDSILAGIYEITEVSTDYIVCGDMEDDSSDCNVDVIIGGEFLLQDALDETDATDYSVEIHVRDNITLSSSINVDFGGGSVSQNSFKRIKGYNTSPGDMDYGGTYYQSPSEILKAGSIDNTKAVLLNGNTGNFEIFDIAISNIVIENFHCYNSGTANIVLYTSTPQNIVLRNCRFSSGAFVYNAAAHLVLVDSCYSHDDLTGNHYQMSGHVHVILNCVAKLAATKIFAVIATVLGSQVIGCVVVNGGVGIRVFANDVTAIENTFYNQTAAGIDVTAGLRAIAFNNIFDMYPGAVAFVITTSGSFLYNDYNCFIESDGTPLLVGYSADSETPLIGPNSIAVDPQFMDAANYNFRLKPTSPCLNSGRSIDDGYTNTGAWQRISRIRR